MAASGSPSLALVAVDGLAAGRGDRCLRRLVRPDEPDGDFAERPLDVNADRTSAPPRSRSPASGTTTTTACPPSRRSQGSASPEEIARGASSVRPTQAASQEDAGTPDGPGLPHEAHRRSRPDPFDPPSHGGQPGPVAAPPGVATGSLRGVGPRPSGVPLWQDRPMATRGALAMAAARLAPGAAGAGAAVARSAAALRPSRGGVPRGRPGRRGPPHRPGARRAPGHDAARRHA